MFATLLFWGWQSNMLLYGAIAGTVLEASRWVKLRWDLEDVDFNRIFSFCILVMVAAAGYVFSTNDVGGGLKGMFQGPAAVRNASISTELAADSVFRWLPLIGFPFIAAQVYNVRHTVPLTAVSLILRLRRRRGERSLAGHYVDISYAYFVICLFAAGIHANQGTVLYLFGYFFGQAALILWVLWALRSERFGLKVWAAGLAVVMVFGFLGLVGVRQLELAIQNFDAQLLARWLRHNTSPTQSMTTIGQIGELKLSPRIIIRMEPEKAGLAPSYLREASYHIFQERNQTWLAGSAGNDFSLMAPQPDNTTWLLVSNKVGTATVNIACYLNGRSHDGDPEGVLPLPSGCCRLLNLPYTVSIVALETNKTGVARATGAGLMIFDARYGSGATFDSPPDTSTNQLDLCVPTNEIAALNQVIAGLDLPLRAGDAEKRLAAQAFFARSFTYSTWQGSEKRSATNTPLTRFLLTSRSGHCEYFATATVLLLRQMGIPARYAVGYAVHETSGSGYVVRERDAHAWCLVWNHLTGTWEDFDTTPASWVAIEGRNNSMFDVLSDMRSWLVFQYEKFRWRQTDLRKYVLWTLTPVMAVLLYYILFQRRAKARAAQKKAAAEAPVVWPGHDSAFYRLEKSLAERGLPRQPQEPLSNWLERALAEPLLADLRRPLRELLQLHYRYRFDPLGLNDDEKKSLIQNTDAVLGTLAGMKRPTQFV